MGAKNFPKSIKKYFRKQKSRIRREVFDSKRQRELISDLYSKQSIIKSRAASSEESG